MNGWRRALCASLFACPLSCAPAPEDVVPPLVPDGASLLELGAAVHEVHRPVVVKEGADITALVDVDVWQVETVCTEFGCTDVWSTERTSACLALAGAAVPGSCPSGAPVATWLDTLPEGLDVTAALDSLRRHRDATATITDALVVELAGERTLLADVRVERPVLSEYKVERAGFATVREWWVLVARDVDGSFAPVQLEPAPESVAFLAAVSVTVEGTTSRLAHVARDGRVSEVAVDDGHLTLTPIEGGHHDAAAGAVTAVAGLFGDEVVQALLVDQPLDAPTRVAPSYVEARDLYAWSTRGSAGAAAPLSLFLPVVASVPGYNVVSACFSRRIDAASLAGAVVEVGGSPVLEARLVSAQCLLSVVEPLDPRRPSSLVVRGLRSESAEPLARDLVLSLPPLFADAMVPSVTHALKDGGGFRLEDDGRLTRFAGDGTSRVPALDATAAAALGLTSDDVPLSSLVESLEGLGVWLTLPNGIAFTDGEVTHLWSYADHPELVDAALRPGDAGRATASGPNGAFLLESGAKVAFLTPPDVIPSLGPVVLVLNDDRGVMQTTNAEELLVSTTEAPVALGQRYTEWAAQHEGELWFFGADRGVEVYENGAFDSRLAIAVLGISLGPAGGLWVDGGNRVYRVASGDVVETEVRDPLTSEGLLTLPRGAGALIYARSTYQGILPVGRVLPRSVFEVLSP